MRRRPLLLAVPALAGGCSSREADPGGPITLTFWHGADPPPNRVVLGRLVDEFNRSQSDIRVREVYAGQQDQQIPKILAAVVGGSPPDLLWFNSTLTGQLVKNDAIIPLDDFLAREALLDGVFANLRPATRYRGQTWSLPFDTNNLAVFYHRRIFAQANIRRMPRTWSEFAELASYLSVVRSGRSIRTGIRLPLGKGEWVVFNWLPYFWAAGGELVRAGRPQLDSAAGIEALAFWRQLLTSGAASLSQPEQGYMFDDFFAGRVAMQVSGPWTLGELAENGMDYGVFPLPRGKVGATVVGGEQLFLMKTTTRREQACWKFARYILGSRFQSAWATGTGYLPVTHAAVQTPVYRTFLAKNPVLKVFLEQMPLGRNRPLDPTYPQISEVVGLAIEQVLQGVRTPEQALASAQREAALIARTQPGDVV